MSILTYGIAGDRWPLQQGEIWGIGPHILACGDLELHQAAELLARYGPAALILADPPYTQGQATGYRRKMGSPQPVHFPSLIGNILDLGSPENPRACLETGKASEALFTQLAAERGAIISDVWDITYDRSNPCKLLHLFWGYLPHPSPNRGAPTGMDEADAYGWCIEQFTEPGDLIFDPCIGQGSTARSAHSLGRRILGMEINPRRLAVTMDWIVRHVEKQPQKIGYLKERVNDDLL